MLFKRIEAWCKENNTSIFALEKACGFGNTTIRGWKDFVPRVESLLKVSQVTGIPFEELIRLVQEGAAEEVR